MKIGRNFNTITKSEYYFYIDNYKKYTDFNTLGLYRSLLENQKISPEERIEVRDYAHERFRKTFDFLQLKDPMTFIKVSTLGQLLTAADEHQLWENVRVNQEKILKDKKIKHRNFGVYSKHDCGYRDCPFNGLMVKQGSFFCESTMRFDSDKSKYHSKEKSKKLKKENRQFKQSGNRSYD